MVGENQAMSRAEDNGIFRIARIFEDESGATAIEYALIGCLLSITIVGTVATLGHSLRSLYEGVSGDVASVLN